MDTDRDGDDLIHIVIVSDIDTDILPYECTAKLRHAINQYLQDNDMAHTPVSCQINNEDCHNSKKNSPMRSHSLIEIARLHLAHAAVDEEPEEFLRQAQISAHYAMFHAICESLIDTTTQDLHARPNEIVQNKLYRAFIHSIFNQQPSSEFKRIFNQPIQGFMELAGNLKRKRDRAEYSRDYTFGLRDVLVGINHAESAISEFQPVHEKEAARYVIVPSLVFSGRVWDEARIATL